jgi:Prolyl-tRNA synthetase
MAHGDDDGVVLPPRIAPTHIVILPITKEETRANVLETCDRLAAELRAKKFLDDVAIEVEVDRAISAAELRIGTGLRKVCRCELRSGRVILKKIRSQ